MYTHIHICIYICNLERELFRNNYCTLHNTDLKSERMMQMSPKEFQWTHLMCR